MFLFICTIRICESGQKNPMNMVKTSLKQLKDSMERMTMSILLGILATGCMSQDWPDWRGSDRDGVWKESGIIQEFASDVIGLKWSVPVGPGYSGPTVSNGKVYLTDRM